MVIPINENMILFGMFSELTGEREKGRKTFLMDAKDQQNVIIMSTILCSETDFCETLRGPAQMMGYFKAYVNRLAI